MLSRSSPRHGSLRSGLLPPGLVIGCLTAMAAALAAATTAAADQDAASFDYFYIESNEGGSSGGHTAVRFGQDVYHFQNEAGLLVLRRERAHDFLYTYALLGNRTVHSTRIGVSEASLSDLVDRFRVRHRAQEAQLRVEDALARDRGLLESLHDRQKDPKSAPEERLLSVPGLGYFDLLPSTTDDRSATLLSLGHNNQASGGGEFIDDLIELFCSFIS